MSLIEPEWYPPTPPPPWHPKPPKRALAMETA